jgi:uncharacterized protein
MLEFVVRRYLYHPTRLRPDAPLPPWAPDAEEVWLDADDGNRIHGLWWAPPQGRPTILFLHGNAQSVYEWALVREDLAALECGLLLIDYPGYGKSSGDPEEQGLYASGRAALRWLLDERQLPPGQVVVLGKSLGGGVATEIVRDRVPGGVILESTFRSVPSVARRLLPMVPADAVLSEERYESLARVDALTMPLLVVHGTHDELIPFEEGQGLFDAAPEPKELYAVQGAGHNDVSMVAGAAYGERLRAWLDHKIAGE